MFGYDAMINSVGGSHASESM
jgi:hypothetical protein